MWDWSLPKKFLRPKDIENGANVLLGASIKLDDGLILKR
jgi:hypothetical protein